MNPLPLQATAKSGPRLSGTTFACMIASDLR
jgi:hypothetical protein